MGNKRRLIEIINISVCLHEVRVEIERAKLAGRPKQVPIISPQPSGVFCFVFGDRAINHNANEGDKRQNRGLRHRPCTATDPHRWRGDRAWTRLSTLRVGGRISCNEKEGASAAIEIARGKAGSRYRELGMWIGLCRYGVYTICHTYLKRVQLPRARADDLVHLMKASALSAQGAGRGYGSCLLYTSPSPRD